jgi:hypothetical protein
VKRFMFLAGVAMILGTFQGVAAQTQPPSQPPTTWTWIHGSDASQGYYYATGPNKNKFQPCNTAAFIEVSLSELHPTNEVCPPPPTGPSFTRPLLGWILSGKPFFSPTAEQLNKDALNTILQDPKKTQDLMNTLRNSDFKNADAFSKNLTFGKTLILKPS